MYAVFLIWIWFLVGKGFVGFQNYIEAFADKRLWNSLWVTIRFTLIEVTVQMVVGLVLAALLTRNTARNKIFRAGLFPADCMFGNGSGNYVADVPAFECRDYDLLV